MTDFFNAINLSIYFRISLLNRIPERWFYIDKNK